MTFSMLSFQPSFQYYSVVISFILVLGLAFFTTKWLAKGKLKTMEGKNIQVIERVYLGADKQLLIVQVGDQYLLLSQDKSGVRKIETLTDFTPSEVEEPQKFADLLDRIRKNKGS